MDEPAVRRIIIACDAACDIRVAVEDAAALAERWNAALHGIFLEDENLYRLAGLPFGRQVTLSSAVSESFDTADLEKLSSALGAAMRRTLAEAAAERGLEWSFDVVRDLPTVAALAGIEADILVVDAAARPFSGSWRPRSFWNILPGESARTILLRRQRRTGPGTVVVVLGNHRQRLLLSALTVAGPGDEVVVLARDRSPSDVEAVERMAESPATGPKRNVRIEAAPANMPALLRRIEQLKAALIVVDAGKTGGDAVRDLLAGTRCDVLLVK